MIYSDYMYLLVGLGNPGAEYESTRHNVGWIILDRIFSSSAWRENKYANCMEAQSEISGVPVTAIKPLTFMNESGQSVDFYVQKNGITPECVIVIYDDLDLPIGTVKISFDRGSGGHNGIKSLEQHLNSREFIRIRVGISRILENGTMVKPTVLGKFDQTEMQFIDKSVQTIHNAVATIMTEGKEKAMSLFNQTLTDNYNEV